MAQTVKNPPAVWETWVRYLGWEDPWRRAWQLTPVFLPGEFQGQRSLAGYSPWGRKELDTTEQLHHHQGYTEKAMATHSGTLAWKIPWTEESGGLQSMGLLRVGHD